MASATHDPPRSTWSMAYESAAPLPPLRRPSTTQMLLALALFALTGFTTTTLGAGWYLSTRTDIVTDLVPLLTASTIRDVWTDPDLLATGLSFSLPLLFILLCHELGHYFACRRHHLPATLPYFLPAPFLLGTLGAFIRIRSPISTRKQLLDVGAAGPIAGFVALLPFLVLGLASAEPASVTYASDRTPGTLGLLMPGKSLLVALIERLFHGDLEPGMVLNLPPFALAAWIGLLVTALNLLPLGQLDGGHILYAVRGVQKKGLTLSLLMCLAMAGFAWPGWWLWCVIILVLGLKHPPVRSHEVPLNKGRLMIAVSCLAILILTFIPVPFDLVIVAGP